MLGHADGNGATSHDRPTPRSSTGSDYDGMEDFGYPGQVCPITHKVMENPVCTLYGHCYEGSALEAWLEKRHVDPMTNQPLLQGQYVPALSMRGLIRQHYQAVLDGKFGVKPNADVKEQIKEYLDVPLETPSHDLLSEEQHEGIIDDAIQLCGTAAGVCFRAGMRFFPYFISLCLYGGVGVFAMDRCRSILGADVRAPKNWDALVTRSRDGLMFPFALFGLAFATGSVGVLAKYAKQCAIHSDGLEDPIDVREFLDEHNLNF